MTTDTTHTNH